MARGTAQGLQNARPEGDRVDESFSKQESSEFKRNEEQDKKDQHEEEKTPKTMKSVLLEGIKSVMLMAAISLHSVFAGIAIGIASDNGDAWTLGASILLHKWAEGVALVRAHKR